MTQHLDAVGVTVGDDRKLGIMVDHIRCIDQLAVHAAGQCRLRQAGPDGSRDISDAYRRVEGPL